MTPDYLKAHEFLSQTQTIPILQNPQRDDLHSMEIGLLGFKGRVHFQISPRIKMMNSTNYRQSTQKSELLANILKVIDKAIHTNYKIYPGNYIAYDILDGQKRFADRYTNKDQTTFANYLNSQLAKIPNVTSKDRDSDRAHSLHVCQSIEKSIDSIRARSLNDNTIRER